MIGIAPLARVFCFILVFGSVGSTFAQPASVGAVPGGEVVGGAAQAEYAIRTLFVDADSRVVIVAYDEVTPEGVLRQNRQGRFFLDNDASIHYKMAMLMLLRDAIADRSLKVFISIVPETEDTSLRIIRSVALQ